MDDPLRRFGIGTAAFLRLRCFLQIEHNVLARAMHPDDPLALERRGDDAGGRLERLFPRTDQTDSMVSPVARLSRPRTMVSTSGVRARSQDTGCVVMASGGPDGAQPYHPRSLSTDFTFAPPQLDSVC